MVAVLGILDGCCMEACVGIVVMAVGSWVNGYKERLRVREKRR